MYFIPIFIITIIAIDLSLYLNRRFSEMLPITFMIIGLSLYLFGLCRILLIGYYFLIIFSILLFILYLYKKHENDKLKKKQLIEGIIVWVIVTILVYIFNIGKTIVHWDDYSHWVRMPIDMFRFNELYCIKSMALTFHNDYPPFCSLVEYFFCRACNICDDHTIRSAYQLLCISIVFPFLKFVGNDDDKKILNILRYITLVLIYIFTFRFFTSEINPLYTILSDSYMALVFAFSMFLIFNNKKDDNVNVFMLIVTLSALILTKQMSIVLFLVAVVSILFNNIILKNGTNLQTVLSILIPTIFKLSHKILLKILHLGGQFMVKDISLTKFFNILLLHNGDDYRIKVFDSFIVRIFTDKIMFIPLWIYYVAFVVLCIALYLLSKKRKDCLSITGVFVICCLGMIPYLASLLVLYMFCFSEGEAIYLASFYRYVSTYILSILILFAFFVILLFKDSYNGKCKNIILLLTLLIMFISIFIGKTPRIIYYFNILESDTNENNCNCDNRFDSIEDDAKILYIDGSNYLNASMNTMKIAHALKYRVLVDSFVGFDFTIDEFVNLYKNYDYVFVNATDEIINDRFKECFPNGIINYGLYEVINGSLYLK